MLCLHLKQEPDRVYNGYICCIKDPWNWLDVIYVYLLLKSTIIFKQTVTFTDEQHTVVMIAGGLVWTMLLTLLRNAFLRFALFVSGFVNIVKELEASTKKNIHQDHDGTALLVRKPSVTGSSIVCEEGCTCKDSSSTKHSQRRRRRQFSRQRQ